MDALVVVVKKLKTAIAKLNKQIAIGVRNARKYILELIDAENKLNQLETKAMQSQYNLEGKSKKELKELAKEAKDSGFPEYIHLGIANETTLVQYLNKYYSWIDKSSEREQQQKLWENQQQQRKQVEQLQYNQNKLQQIESIKKKLENETLLSSSGDLIKNLIELSSDYRASVWSKNGEMRIYLKDTSYTNPKDAGFILVSLEKGITTYFSRSISIDLEKTIQEAKALLNVSINDLVAHVKYRNPDQVKAAIAQGENVSGEEIINSLDVLYGVGGWDSRDREDFEG